MSALAGRRLFFQYSVELVLAFAYPGKFEINYYDPGPARSVPVVYQMTAYASNEMRDCDDELEAAVRALKANMHAVPSLSEIAHDCVVANGFTAALKGLELAQPWRPPDL
jgi:hypothetical protein